MLYEMLVGPNPFKIRNERELRKIVDGEIYFPPDVPISKNAQSLIKQLLNKDISSRIRIREMLEHEFLRSKKK